jgi:hypothetical protein
MHFSARFIDRNIPISSQRLNNIGNVPVGDICKRSITFGLKRSGPTLCMDARPPVIDALQRNSLNPEGGNP